MKKTYLFILCIFFVQLFISGMIAQTIIPLPNMVAVSNNGDVLTYNSTTKTFLASAPTAGATLAGDVTGSIGATTVGKMQGRTISNTAPNSGQVLGWNGTAWAPTSISTTPTISNADPIGSNYASVGTNWLNTATQKMFVSTLEGSSGGSPVTVTEGNRGSTWTTSTTQPSAAGNNTRYQSFTPAQNMTPTSITMVLYAPSGATNVQLDVRTGSTNTSSLMFSTNVTTIPNTQAAAAAEITFSITSSAALTSGVTYYLFVNNANGAQQVVAPQANTAYAGGAYSTGISDAVFGVLQTTTPPATNNVWKQITDAAISVGLPTGNAANGAVLANGVLNLGFANNSGPGIIKNTGTQTLGTGLELLLQGKTSVTKLQLPSPNQNNTSSTAVRVTTGGFTLPSTASGVDDGAVLFVYNEGSVTCAFALNDANDKLNGVTGGTYSLPVNQCVGLRLNQSTKDWQIITGSTYKRQLHTSGSTVTIDNTSSGLHLNPASSFSTLVITLPTSPYDGQVVDITAGGTIAAGATVAGGVSYVGNLYGSASNTILGGETVRWVYNAAISKWLKTSI
jgi:hypothetical protein